MAMLFDGDGNILIHSNDYDMRTSNVFDMQALKNNKDKILSNYYTLDVYEYKDGQSGIQETLSEKGISARWGGDEFTGYIFFSRIKPKNAFV